MWFSARQTAKKIRRQTQELTCLSDSALLDQSKSLAFQARRTKSVADIVVPAYALVVEACRRELGIVQYDVQLIGAVHMANRCVIQMQTGEGKTLTAPLPLFLHALQGKGAHLATSNDYLAARDAAQMAPVFSRLGMTIGVVTSECEEDDRRNAYACDITYGTMTEFGFDFLRDRLKGHARKSGHDFPCVMRGLYFVLADEADSLMIDDANTPLIIGAEGRLQADEGRLYHWANGLAPQLHLHTHYRYRLNSRSVELTREGRRCVRASAIGAGLENTSRFTQFEAIERAVLVHRDFHKDRQYIVRDEELALITEVTGRVGEGRQWQDGIHQTLQARENLEITPPTTHSSKLTLQALFLTYQHIAGMTGTGVLAQRELRNVYKTKTVSISTHLKNIRKSLPTRSFQQSADKWSAICDETKAMRNKSRPVLIGTRSVEKSELVSKLLTQQGIPHCVLNAKEHGREAEIVAEAGKAGKVTVATGMAGRGTDIKLDEEALTAGGLHVILSELHDSPRMDRQLIGRSARQGQPGSYRQFLALDDVVLELGLGAEAAKRFCRSAKQRLSNASIERTLRGARNRLDRRKTRNRMAMLHNEKKKLRSLWEMGQDPLLDAC